MTVINHWDVLYKVAMKEVSQNSAAMQNDAQQPTAFSVANSFWGVTENGCFPGTAGGF